MKLDELPTDALEHVFSYLNIQDTFSLAKVNRALYQASLLQRLSVMLIEARKRYEQQIKILEANYIRASQDMDKEISRFAFCSEDTLDAKVDANYQLEILKKRSMLPLPTHLQQSQSLSPQALHDTLLSDPSFAQALFNYLSILPQPALLAWFAQTYKIEQASACLPCQYTETSQLPYSQDDLSDNESIPSSLPDLDLFDNSPMSSPHKRIKLDDKAIATMLPTFGTFSQPTRRDASFNEEQQINDGLEYK